ncbi:restriction endonuclease subunit S [Lactococcus lactis]|uniref:restriction endonuclease subunit S n=1 Tax=Lactococcus lactis TaxID=1358 RepID=UPI0020B7C800|nr:restriction endonuclease subunit S [Lactococcus lactis]
MKEKVKAPELRFPGFTDDWEERKLKDVVEKQIKGKAQFEKLAPGDVEYLDTSRLNGGQAILTNGLKDVMLDDVLILWDGSKAGTVYHGFEGSLGSTLKAYRTSADSKFVYQYLKRYQDNIYNNYRTPNIPHVQKDFLDVFTISVPRSDEQAKIGSFFKQLDDTIALHQHKLDLLKEQKKGYLQKMFPKNGEKVPELRFAGFADDWEERKLGELSNIVGGGTPSTSNSEYWDGDIDWYAPAEIGEQRYVSKSKKTITELGLKKSSARILPVGTVLFTSRAGIGNTAILGKEATTNQGFQSIVPNPNKLDSYFIYSRTNELKRYGEVTGAGSTFVEVSGKQMSKMSIMVPELSEQKKIGSFFEQLDNTIALHQRKLDLLKEQKKGYLQKMFV